MKVVQEQLGHSSMAITADTYTSVLPAVAHAAAEAVADAVPRRSRPAGEEGRNHTAATPLAVRLQSGSQEDSVHGKTRWARENTQVRQGAPSGTRTPNPLIKSQLLCLLS